MPPAPGNSDTSSNRDQYGDRTPFATRVADTRQTTAAMSSTAPAAGSSVRLWVAISHAAAVRSVTTPKPASTTRCRRPAYERERCTQATPTKAASPASQGPPEAASVTADANTTRPKATSNAVSSICAYVVRPMTSAPRDGCSLARKGSMSSGIRGSGSLPRHSASIGATDAKTAATAAAATGFTPDSSTAPVHDTLVAAGNGTRHRKA